MQVELVWAEAPRRVRVVTLTLPPGTTVAQALQASGWPVGEALAQGRLGLSVWGRKAALDTPLRDGDRLELTRPLRVDPKVARRERFARQGARAPGLFARRRP
ncbi:sulfur carrier protein/hypothetical protein [Tepidimonas ignava]|uniref:UPF0125 protein EDC36_10817 n=1 Tax=Tepidimonas ignava TaxID=114249 RepID=A0A4R3LCE0_9BURK|nr:RnfH family protein [Tepidimonas ignava]TCS97613.1 sulfur carrier protein/hypothetical protein [Tepidimonas ignava]TSE24112.1 Persistence and stress-resistance antitoxin PasI [Tepidimonas ignava]